MNKNILLAASAVMALGFSSCDEEGEYTLEMNSNNVSTLLTLMSGVELVSSNVTASDIDSSSDILIKASSSETIDCEDGGTITVITDEVGDTVTGTSTFTQCAEYGQTVTGNMAVVAVSNGDMGGTVSTTGNYTVTGIDGITSLEYKDFVLNTSSDFGADDEQLNYEFAMSATLELVSDDISGTFGLSLIIKSEGDTETAVATLMGADDSIYVDSSLNDVSTCTLNEEVVACFE